MASCKVHNQGMTLTLLAAKLTVSIGENDTEAIQNCNATSLPYNWILSMASALCYTLAHQPGSQGKDLK